MVLFKVNNVDFTEYVIQKSYSVQEADVYTSWTDGNWITHRVISRQQISGSFNMTFTTEAEYDAFKVAVDAAKTPSGYCPIQIFVNTTKTLETINAFVDFTAKNRWTMEAFGGDPEIAAVTVKITER